MAAIADLKVLWRCFVLVWSALLLILPAGASSSPSKPAVTSISPGEVPPRLMREFRGAWVATVSNIDWPSKPGLPVEQQKAELIALLDKAVELRLNAIILQVRPACDALYASTIEPWSAFLTGKMGQTPAPFYDPLKFAVEQAHARGLELHAWFNPYRAGFTGREVSANHISRTHPRLVKTYGQYLWLDPAEKAVQDHTTTVILDVVRRYDIDGVHMDDYFYPYPTTNKAGGNLDFPDDASWKKYKAAGGKLERSDWRRENVNKLIQRLDKEIKRQKPWVAFGVSPFGIWRPGHPAQIKGLDAYERLYADAREWLQKGWLDYLSPQLYWPIDPPAQSYTALYAWWQEQNVKNLPIWPGGAVTRVSGKRWPADEIVRQIEVTRQSPVPGHIHWNISSLMKNPDDLHGKILSKAYLEPAVVPPMRNSAKGSLPKPQVQVTNAADGGRLVAWNSPAKSPRISQWIVQTQRNGKWQTRVLSGSVTSLKFAEDNIPETVAVSGRDQYRTMTPAALASLR